MDRWLQTGSLKNTNTSAPSNGIDVEASTSKSPYSLRSLPRQSTSSPSAIVSSTPVPDQDIGMPQEAVIGDIADTGREATVEWTIKKFSSLSDKANYCYVSPPFFFCNSRWRSGIFPNGETTAEMLSIYDEILATSEGWVSLSLIPMDSGGAPVDVTFQYSLKKPKNVNFSLPSPAEMPKGSRRMSGQKLVLRSVLMNRKPPPATLVVSCHLKCVYPGGAFSERLLHLSPNFQAIEDMKKFSDFTVKVENREFYCHRVILANRSGYFSRLFDTDMEEQRRNEVEIGDLEASVFELVLNYLYCGNDKMLSKENVFKIYKASDQLFVTQLKETCAEYLKENMGSDIVCEVITLAKMYEDEELEESALDYFKRHSNDVLQSPNWTDFKKETNREFVIEVLEETVKKMAGENSDLLRDKERQRHNTTYASSSSNEHDMSDYDL